MPKYFITAPRFLNGQFIHATPNQPATIEVPEGTKVDKGMTPVEKGEPAKPQQHFSKAANGALSHPQSTVVKPADGKPAVEPVKDAGKEPARPQDKKVL